MSLLPTEGMILRPEIRTNVIDNSEKQCVDTINFDTTDPNHGIRIKVDGFMRTCINSSIFSGMRQFSKACKTHFACDDGSEMKIVSIEGFKERVYAIASTVVTKKYKNKADVFFSQSIWTDVRFRLVQVQIAEDTEKLKTLLQWMRHSDRPHAYNRKLRELQCYYPAIDYYGILEKDASTSMQEHLDFAMIITTQKRQRTD